MKPTRIHYFYAKDWPLKIWFLTILPLFVFITLLSCQPSLEAFQDKQMRTSLGWIVVLSLLLGYFSAILLGWFVLGPLYHDRMLKNGGPFNVGDQVRILAGPHEGDVAQVYSQWQGNTVRVDLGEMEKKKFKDIFAPTQLLKEDKVQQSERTEDK